jgi:hypothetical protein
LISKGVVFHVDVAVEADETAVSEARQRVDLGEGQPVRLENARQCRRDRCEPVEVRAGDADGGDQLLRHEVGERQQRREVALGDVCRVLLGDFLDVDAAHVAEDHHRLPCEAVPGDADVVLLRHRRAAFDEHPLRAVAIDGQVEDLCGGDIGFGRCIREEHAAGLHAPACEHL